MINIPKNNYAQPTEVRDEVVQAICQAFMSLTVVCTTLSGSRSSEKPQSM